MGNVSLGRLRQLAELHRSNDMDKEGNGMTANSQLRGWPIYWHKESEQWRFVDTDEPTITTWANRPCGYCGLYGNSNYGDVDPCLGNLAGVTNACCGHGNPDDAYICFIGGLTLRGFHIADLHDRQLPGREQMMIREHNEARREFRQMPSHDQTKSTSDSAPERASK